MGKRARIPGGRKLFGPLAALAVLLAIAAGSWLQYGERTALEAVHQAGDPEAADRIDVTATIQRVDAAARELTLRVLVVPRGALSDDGGISPNADLSLLTSPDVRQDLSFPAHTRIASVDVPVALSGGSISDYPLDEYLADIDFEARQGGERVPVSVELSNKDTLFQPEVEVVDSGSAAVFEVGMARSSGVLIYSFFMMAAMWALALSVAAATRFLLAQRRGLVWPALGWMAATLFALAAFRNTAPGSPPIGSLLDYAAFLWAEAVIALCVVLTVAAGLRTEAPVPPS
ncbi:DUF4436 family protein [Paeniglutamicibacter sp. R2-26]|uniref:DUF4436 family protein n=1 Tax=Paeniglutamicibacter sp. R2-26 TaxID=3144417 RepID=UPI003EE43D14